MNTSYWTQYLNISYWTQQNQSIIWENWGCLEDAQNDHIYKWLASGSGWWSYYNLHHLITRGSHAHSPNVNVPSFNHLSLPISFNFWMTAGSSHLALWMLMSNKTKWSHWGNVCTYSCHTICKSHPTYHTLGTYKVLTASETKSHYLVHLCLHGSLHWPVVFLWKQMGKISITCNKWGVTVCPYNKQKYYFSKYWMTRSTKLHTLQLHILVNVTPLCPLCFWDWYSICTYSHLNA